jgi:hypothetical protein
VAAGSVDAAEKNEINQIQIHHFYTHPKQATINFNK